MSANSNDNAIENSNNIIFTIKKSELYVAVISLSAKDNQKVSKLLSKEFRRLVYWNEFETKSDT